MEGKVPDDIKNKDITEEEDNEDVTWLLTHVTTVTRDELSHFWWHLEPVTDYGMPSSCLCHAGWENYESTESENHDHCPGLSLAAVSSNNTSSSDKTKYSNKHEDIFSFYSDVGFNCVSKFNSSKLFSPGKHSFCISRERLIADCFNLFSSHLISASQRKWQQLPIQASESNSGSPVNELSLVKTVSSRETFC